VQITPHNPAAALGFGQELYRLGRLEEAAAQFERYIEMRRESAAGYANLGQVRLQQRQTNAAAVAYREAYRLDPQDDNALLGLGVALYESGQFAAAREAFEALLILLPGSYAATVNLGALCERQGDLRCASERYEQATRIDPRDTVARDGLRRLRQQRRSPTG
jgi:tetratricopeptide (TPR) repeat protein